MEEAQYQKGVAQFAQMVGQDHIDALRQRFQALAPDFERLVMGTIGGEVWNRPGLDLRTRSLCSIAVLAGLGRVNALELNIRMALNNGATKEARGGVALESSEQASERGFLQDHSVCDCGAS